jgi:hypothetical protein
MNDRYWDDPVFREAARRYGREYSAWYRAYARDARRDLRSLMAMGPHTTRLIRRHIDIWSASDAEVKRFYDQFKWRLEYAKRTGQIFDW